MINKFSAVLLLFSLFFVISPVLGQHTKYSIDVKETKDNHIPLKFRVNKAKDNYKNYKEHKKEKKIEARASRKIKRHTYRIQTRKVKKRMKYSVKKSENYNNGKVPFYIKIKNRLRWKT